jgi:hypothetical protein
MAIKRIPVFHNPDNYVFIPACCYAGNQFHVLKYGYTPMFRLHDAKVDMPVTITDVPRLELDGSGKIEVNTGDAATPCVGVFSATEKRGILVFTVQQINGKNLGLAYENGEIRLSWPVKRDLEYRMCHTFENETPWVDESAEIPCKIMDFPCQSLAEFFRIFFENRKIMGLDDKRPQVMPFEKQFQVQREKFNAMNWNEELGLYMVGTDGNHFQVWQPGWTGGALSGYPLMKLGGQLELERQMKTLGVEDSVTLLGFHKNPYQYVVRCDLYVCSSWREGFSTSVTESLVVGTPVVSTNCSGAKELLGDHDEYGFVVVNSEEGIYQGMRRMLADPALLTHYKAQAKLRGTFFSRTATVRAVEEMLEKL